MTLRQFAGMLNEISNVLKMELGGDDKGESTSLTGQPAAALAQRIFPRGRK